MYTCAGKSKHGLRIARQSKPGIELAAGHQCGLDRVLMLSLARRESGP